MRKLYQFLLVLSLSAVLVLPTIAQDTPIVTIALPGFWDTALGEDTFTNFEAQTNAQVEVVYTNFPPFRTGYDADSTADFMDEMASYVSQADVVYMTSNTLIPEVTYANYLLDLAPLVNADAVLDTGDFYPAVWESFQWDTRLWGLPVSASPVMLRFNSDAFDAAGVSYPDANWTLNELTQAARALSERDANNAITLPGLYVTPDALPLLFASLSGHTFSDDRTNPALPSLNTPILVDLLETWQALEAEGVVSSSFGERFDEIPLQLGTGTSIVTIGIGVGDDNDEPPNFPMPEQTLVATTMPGGIGSFRTHGFAVSSGSNYPELAYQLVRHLTQRADVSGITAIGGEAARRSLSGMDANPQRTLDEQALVADVLTNGLSPADLRFSGYLTLAMDDITNSNDLTEALRVAEESARQIVLATADRATTTQIFVPLPTLPPPIPEGSITLNFGLSSPVGNLPNQNEWDALIADFVAQDPQIARVDIITRAASPEDLLVETQCMYHINNLIPNMDTSILLPIQPLLDTDPNLNADALLGDTLNQVSRDGQVLALPMTILPQILRYSPDDFVAAGLPEPVNGWTVNDFITALYSLQPVIAEDVAPFKPAGFGSSYLLMLIAAQGGLPLDFGTTSITVDFTSPHTVEAIRAVLDLAKVGLIDYSALANDGEIMMLHIGDTSAPLGQDTTLSFGFSMTLDREVRSVTYPVGDRFTPVSYSVSAGYIGRDSAYPEACYRWLSYLAQHSHVMSGMPALATALDEPALAATRGEQVVATYREFATMLSQPNAVSVPVDIRYTTRWLNQAFDAYVLADADLSSVLAEAETRTRNYLECMGGAAIDSPADADFQTRAAQCQAQADS